MTDAAPGERAVAFVPAALAAGDEGLGEGFCCARPSETLCPSATKDAGSREAKDCGGALASDCAAPAVGGSGVAVAAAGEPEDEAGLGAALGVSLAADPAAAEGPAGEAAPVAVDNIVPIVAVEFVAGEGAAVAGVVVVVAAVVGTVILGAIVGPPDRGAALGAPACSAVASVPVCRPAAVAEEGHADAVPGAEENAEKVRRKRIRSRPAR